MEKKRKKMQMLRVLCALALTLVAALGFTACAGGTSAGGAGSATGSAALEEPGAKTVAFTDSCGREVEVPAQIDKIVPSGHTANMVLLSFAPEKMVGLSQEMTDEQRAYLGDRVPDDLPILGAAFGAKGDLNKEAVAATGAQVLIDTGEYKEGIEQDLDDLQEQLGIPCVFIESKLEDWGTAFRMLGELLGEQERGEEFATYCDEAYSEVSGVLEGIPADQRANVLFCTGDDGLGVLAKGSFQANVVDMLANNVAVVDSPSGKGNGNQVSLEQIAQWDPQVILFGSVSGSETMYDKVSTDPTWSTLSAIQNGNYYEIPSVPYNWLNNPPTINQVLGMQWLARVLYPDAFEGKEGIEDVVRGYYKLFYGHELTDAEYADLTARALPKAE